MSVQVTLITVMSMQYVTTPLGLSHVPANLDIQEMDESAVMVR